MHARVGLGLGVRFYTWILYHTSQCEIMDVIHDFAHPVGFADETGLKNMYTRGQTHTVRVRYGLGDYSTQESIAEAATPRALHPWLLHAHGCHMP